MNTTVFKTGTRLNTSSIGINKVIINISGGALTFNNYFIIGRKKFGNGEYDFYPAIIKTYNGSLYAQSNDTSIEERLPNYLIDNYTDEDGNNIKIYRIPGTYGTAVSLFFRWGIGTTRIEILDVDKLEFAGLSGSAASPITEGEMNIEQFAYLPFKRLQAYCAHKAYGDIKALKDRNDILTLFARDSQITGDINNLAKSALTLESVSAYYSKMYGELVTLLETMKASGVKNKTVNFSVGGSGITYNGKSYSDSLYCTFDANGNYTVSETEPN